MRTIIAKEPGKYSLFSRHIYNAIAPANPFVLYRDRRALRGLKKITKKMQDLCFRNSEKKSLKKG